MGLQAGISPRYVTKPTRSTQPCIHLGLLNQIPALVVWGKGARCDHISHGSSRSCDML